jgi:DNA end-binding protein Ku
MRAIWKGHINFALVSIPVSVFSATRSSDISLKYLHKKDLSPVSYKRFCDTEGTEVEWEEITRGYEFEKGRFIEVTKDELQQANARLTRSIQIVEFVDIAEIDPVYFDKPYYLEPQTGGEHAYGLFVDALEQSGRVGIARVVLKSREHLAAVRPAGRMMTMQTLRFDYELSDMSSLNAPRESVASDKEMELARTLIGTMSGTFDPSAYKDEYRAQLLDLIQKKVAGERIGGEPDALRQTPAQVVDLMEVLKQSLKGKRSGKRSPASGEKTVVARPARKKPQRSRTRKTG